MTAKPNTQHRARASALALLVAVGGMGSLASIQSAHAEVFPRAVSPDGRVKTVTYNETDVVSLRGVYGFQTTIKFAPFEKIQNISMGDSIAWQVVPNKAGNILFVKPVESRARTNMTVITDRRIYNFDLSTEQSGLEGGRTGTYLLSFNYPQDSVLEYSSASEAPTNFNPVAPFAPRSEVTSSGLVSAGAPTDLNFEYSFKGDEELAPATVFDNGEFTYFKFADTADVPAIFAVDKDRNESVINYHVEGPYIVVNSSERQFTLRNGDYEACVFNDAFASNRSLLAVKGQG